MTAQTTFNMSPGISATITTVILIVEDEEIPIEARYLRPIDYFNAMLTNGLQESRTGRIKIPDFSKETVKAFLHFLTNYELPPLDGQHQLELYALLHQYNHEPLLKKVRQQITDLIPAKLATVLQYATLYSDDALKQSCREYVGKNSYSTTNLLLQLIDEGDFAAIEEVYQWPNQSICQMFTCSQNSKTPFQKLLDQQKYVAAAKFLRTANSKGIRADSIIQNTQAMVAQLLNQTTPPSEEQNELIIAIAASNPTCLTYTYGNENPPLFVVLEKGWNGTFEKMVPLCKDSIAELQNRQRLNLIGQAISLRRIEAIRTMKRNNVRIHPNQFSKYVFEAIRLKYPALLEEILSFPIAQGYEKASISKECVEATLETQDIAALRAIKTRGARVSPYDFPKLALAAVRTKSLEFVEEIVSLPIQEGYESQKAQVTKECIEEAIDSKDQKIFRAVWPFYQGNAKEINALRKQVYDKNQFHLAEVVFSPPFNASKDIFPQEDGYGVTPWLHLAAIHGNEKWVEFFTVRSADKDHKVRYKYPEYREAIEMTPLLLALKGKKNPKLVIKMLELGFNLNVGNGVFYPIHLVFEQENQSLLEAFVNRNVDLTKTNARGENFFHLYIQSKLKLTNLIEVILKAPRAALEQQDINGNTPLHMGFGSIESEKLADCTGMLISCPDLLWRKNKEKKMPFHMLGGPLFQVVLDAIIASSIQLKADNLKESLLIWCGQQLLYAQCDKLTPHIKDIKSLRISPTGNTLLHIAAQQAGPLAVEKAVKLGIPVNDRNHSSQTALHLAVQQKKSKVVEVLIRLGADPELCDNNGETPLSIALKTYDDPRSSEMLQILDMLEKPTCKVQ